MIVNGKTLIALKASIKHWEENVEARSAYDVSLGCAECALCKLFREANCVQCPVFAATGKSTCMGSPYHDAVDAYDAWIDNDNPTFWKNAARAELRFLKSLLPKEA